MVIDRDGTIGNAWGSLLVLSSAGFSARCIYCGTTTSGDSPGAADDNGPMILGGVSHVGECVEVGHDPLDRSGSPSPGAIMQRICGRCGLVYAEG